MAIRVLKSTNEINFSVSLFIVVQNVFCHAQFGSDVWQQVRPG